MSGNGSGGTADHEYKDRKRAFLEFLEEACDGYASAELSRNLLELVDLLKTAASLKQSKATGRLDLKIAFALAPNGDVTIDYDVELKRPKLPTNQGRMWIGTAGGLTAVHPKQMAIPGTEARTAAGRVLEEIRAPRPAPIKFTPADVAEEREEGDDE